MATTDEITYAFREYDPEKVHEVIIECINHAVRNSVGLANPRVTRVEFDERSVSWAFDDDGDSSDEPRNPAITVTVAGS